MRSMRVRMRVRGKYPKGMCRWFRCLSHEEQRHAIFGGMSLYRVGLRGSLPCTEEDTVELDMPRSFVDLFVRFFSLEEVGVSSPRELTPYFLQSLRLAWEHLAGKRAQPEAVQQPEVVQHHDVSPAPWRIVPDGGNDDALSELRGFFK